jgi:hypothetical protein
VRLCVNLCLLLDNNLCLLLDNNCCLLLDKRICLQWDYVLYWTLPSVDIFYLFGILDSSTFNFHAVNRMLIICESSIGDFLHLTLLQFYLWYYILHIITSCTCWVLTKSTQSCYFPLLYKPATQKLKKIWDSSIRSSRWAVTPGRLPVDSWCSSTVVSSRVFALVFCKILFDNKYIILWHWLFCIHFLYGMCVNLIPRHTYYEYSIWVLKLGMTECYQSRVNCTNASLVRRVIF